MEIEHAKMASGLYGYHDDPNHDTCDHIDSDSDNRVMEPDNSVCITIKYQAYVTIVLCSEKSLNL